MLDPHANSCAFQLLLLSLASLVAVWRRSERCYFRNVFVLAIFSGVMTSFSLLLVLG
jgi:hypothetical protein